MRLLKLHRMPAVRIRPVRRLCTWSLRLRLVAFVEYSDSERAVDSELVLLHDETASLNAQQRQMNDERRLIDDQLMGIDSSRLIISQNLNELQAELSATHQKHMQSQQ